MHPCYNNMYKKNGDYNKSGQDSDYSSLRHKRFENKFAFLNNGSVVKMYSIVISMYPYLISHDNLIITFGIISYFNNEKTINIP